LTTQGIERLSLALHEALRRNDPTAPSKLADLLLCPLVRKLTKAFPNLPDPDTVEDAAIAAMMSYLQRPEQFAPGKSSLLSYLTMSARGDLLNSLKKNGRRKAREVPLDDVELADRSRNNEWGETGEASSGPQIAMMRVVEEQLEDQVDRKLVELMLAGERRTSVFAEVLGISDRTASEVRKIVKRHKDRLKKYLQRRAPDEDAIT
jgi:RNA polymerase sigma-70 factor (ECF subfamily)